MSDKQGQSPQQPSGETPLPRLRMGWLGWVAVILGVAACLLGLAAVPATVGLFLFSDYEAAGECYHIMLSAAWIAGALGMLFGIVRLVRTRRRNQGATDNGGARMAICLPAVGLLVAAIACVAGGAGRSWWQRSDCGASLRDLGLALHEYAIDNQEVFPARLELVAPYIPAGGYGDSRHLVPYYAAHPYVCPADNDPMTTRSGFKTSYRYVGHLVTRPDDAIVLYEHKQNHRGVRLALLEIGFVNFIPEEELKARLIASLKLVKQDGWDDYSEERKREIEAFYTLEQTE